MQKLYTDKTFLNINAGNKHVETQVQVSWANYDISDFDLYNENKEFYKNLEKKLQSGEYLCISILIEASAEGETGRDSIGMCYVKSNDLETEIRNIVAEHDMKNNACRELKAHILEKAVRLSKYISK